MSLQDFSRPRSSGLNAVDLDEGDYLIGAELTDGHSDLMLFTNAGKAVFFLKKKYALWVELRVVRGITLVPQQRVVSLLVTTGEEGR